VVIERVLWPPRPTGVRLLARGTVGNAAAGFESQGYAMLWDYMKTLIMLRLTLEPPCICAGCKRGRRASQPFR